MNHIEIRQDLDPAELAPLTEEARELADELGELDGNQHYVDLSAATWDDVAFALREEARMIREFAACVGAVIAAEELEDGDPDDERAALWWLELGVAAPVIALNALGAHTALSCNGGAFGGVHLRDRPSIRFYPRDVPVAVLVQLARDSHVGLIAEDGRALLYGRCVQDLQRFAALALERCGAREQQEG